VSDLKLFRVAPDGRAQELDGGSVPLEKSLQRLVESNMETFFGVRFLASEYSTGARHGGRIDSLGIDENNSPVIFEYKRDRGESVINQGLFYLDWLTDHKAEFQILVQDRIDHGTATAIDWSSSRVICIANQFTRYDEHAVQQMGRRIELVRYRDFQGELLAFELVSAIRGESQSAADVTSGSSRKRTTAERSVTELLAAAPEDLTILYEELDKHLSSLGDDVSVITNKNYFAYRRLKNFACVEVHPQSRALLVYLKVNPDTLALVEGFSRDVRSIGHFGTGDLELRIKNAEDLARALPLTEQSYENS
jgi:predicted transport protein